MTRPFWKLPGKITCSGRVCYNPPQQNATEPWRCLALAFAAAAAALLLRWSQGGIPLFELNYGLLGLIAGTGSGLLFLNNLQRRLPGLFGAAGNRMAKADYPSLLAGSLALILFHPMANPWAAMLTASIMLYGAILYVEYRVRYGRNPEMAASETPSEENRP